MEELTTEMKVAQKFLSATDSEIASQIEKAKKYIDDIIERFHLYSDISQYDAFQLLRNHPYLIKVFFEMEIAQRILENRKAGITTYNEFTSIPDYKIMAGITTPTSDFFAAQDEYAKREIKKLELDILTITELKQKISNLKYPHITSIYLSLYIQEKTKEKGFGTPHYHQTLLQLRYYQKVANAIVETVNQRKNAYKPDISNTPKSNAIVSHHETPSESPQEKDEKPKTLFTTTNILIGGALFLGIIYFVKNQK